MSLYHKYRPSTLEGVAGNGQTVTALQKMLSNTEKMPRVYMAHGQTGCGKTTLGRIIKSVLEISDNDFAEVNSSDMRGIDTARDLIKNSGYAPMSGKFRMYLIDECHKLTNDAQNALLKLLEDTPKHLIICLCTTEPEKMIKAIQSRCTMLPVLPLQEAEMRVLLKRIARTEGHQLAKEVLDKIVEESTGLVRQAINTLESVLAVPAEQQLKVASLASDQKNASIDLCRALINERASWKEVSTILTGLQGQEAESIRRAVLGYCQAVLLKSNNKRAGMVMDYMIEPFYHTGFPQLVHACYSIMNS